MEKFFSLPFWIGLVYLLIILVYRCIRWISGLSKMDKLRLLKLLQGKRLLGSLKEILAEALLHHKIFLKNPVLGYMHTSLAFGWFLLITVGHLEAMIAKKSACVAFHEAVFFRFYHTSGHFPLAGIFAFSMDFLLLVVLSGLMLAILKRFRKRLFGLRRTTRMKSGDHIALASLWLIFPLRLLAESNAAALYGNGSFLTHAVGHFLASFLNPETANMPLWTMYSTVLGFFFVALPNSRYMHIPAEVVLIFLRQTGIKQKKQNDTYTDVQVFSCSRCGICLDNCQLSVAGIDNSQSVYLLKRIRNRNLNDEELFNCLMCGKCQMECPVGIETVNLRITQRIESTRQYNSSYSYLEFREATASDVVYFAGCMTHLTPGIVDSMKKIFRLSGDKVWFMDEQKAPCCGRPLILAGQYEAARKLIEANTQMILHSGAHTLVVSCPICYRVFKEDYSLPGVQVLFHAEYLTHLIEIKKIQLSNIGLRMVYHDPCELGRGMGMYELPREILDRLGKLLTVKQEKENANCCGGSLGNIKIRANERNLLRDQALEVFMAGQPDVLVTACPKCKKTFAYGRKLPVLDISEIVAQAVRPGSARNMPGIRETIQVWEEA